MSGRGSGGGGGGVVSIDCLTGPVPKGALFSVLLHSSYLDHYEENVGNANDNLDTAKEMYMVTLAPGTVSIIEQCLYTSWLKYIIAYLMRSMRIYSVFN